MSWGLTFEVSSFAGNHKHSCDKKKETARLFMDHPDEAHSPVTEKAKTIAGGCLAQARRGTTSGPKGCGQEVRN